MSRERSRERGRSRDDNTTRQSVLVRNLPMDCRAEEVRSKFERYGAIRDIYLPKDYYTGRPKGFGFVEFLDIRDAEEAIYNLDRTMFGGREIQVVMSKESRKTPRDMLDRERPGRGGGPPSRGGGYDRGGPPSRGAYDDRRGGGGYGDRRGRSRSPRRRRSYSRSRSRDRRRSRTRSRDGRRASRSPARGRSPARSLSRGRSPARSLSRGKSRSRSRSRSPAKSLSRSRSRSMGRDLSRSASPAAASPRGE